MIGLGSRAALVLCITTWMLGGDSFAAPNIELVDNGNHVVIVVPNAVPRTQKITNYSDRIEVAIGKSEWTGTRRFRDRTVKRVDVLGGRNPRISVQLRHGRKKTAAISRHVLIGKQAGGVALEIQRYGHFYARNPEPTEEKQDVPEEVPNVVIEKKESLAEPVAAPPPAAISVAKPVESTPPRLPAQPPMEDAAVMSMKESSEEESGLVAGLMITLILLAGCAALAWHVKRNRTILVPENSLDVVASRVMGSKAKVSLLNAGERQFLLAVNDKGVQLLSQWRRCQSPTTRLGGIGSDERPPREADNRNRLSHSSPAVAGLVALRSRADLPEVNEAVATGDATADEEWARELLIATKKRRVQS